MNLVATASDMRVTINGRSAAISPGGWPPEVARVEWFGLGGVLTLIDGSTVKLTDDAMLVPLIVAWRTACNREAEKRVGWRERLARWLMGSNHAAG